MGGAVALASSDLVERCDIISTIHRITSVDHRVSVLHRTLEAIIIRIIDSRRRGTISRGGAGALASNDAINRGNARKAARRIRTTSIYGAVVCANNDAAERRDIRGTIF